MKLIQILFSVASGLGIVKDLIATKNIQKESYTLYQNMKKSENELIDLFNKTISYEVSKLYEEINSLKIVLRFLTIALIILLVVITSSIIILFILRNEIG